LTQGVSCAAEVVSERICRTNGIRHLPARPAWRVPHEAAITGQEGRWAGLACRAGSASIPTGPGSARRGQSQQEAARLSDLALIRVGHRRPPLRRNAGVDNDGPFHTDGDIALGSGAALPVLADGITTHVGLAEDARLAESAGCEQVNDLVSVCCLQGRREGSIRWSGVIGCSFGTCCRHTRMIDRRLRPVEPAASAHPAAGQAPNGCCRTR